MVSEKELSGIFSEIGKEYGFDTVTADFMAFKDFKVAWERSYRWAEFRVSDYFRDAPEGILVSVAHTIFARITGKDDIPYTKEMCEWIDCDDFVDRNQPTFMKRSRNITRSPTGTFRDLTDSYKRLIDSGLVTYDPRVVLTWNRTAVNDKAGSCSVLMRVVTINPSLDNEDISDKAIDYALFHYLNHIEAGFDMDTRGKEMRVMSLDMDYPDQRSAEAELHTFGVHF